MSLTFVNHKLINIKEIYCSTTTWYWILRVSLRQILLINRPVSLMTAHSAAKLFRDLPERPPWCHEISTQVSPPTWLCRVRLTGTIGTPILALLLHPRSLIYFILYNIFNVSISCMNIVYLVYIFEFLY